MSSDPAPESAAPPPSTSQTIEIPSDWGTFSSPISPTSGRPKSTATSPLPDLSSFDPFASDPSPPPPSPPPEEEKPAAPPTPAKEVEAAPPARPPKDRAAAAGGGASGPSAVGGADGGGSGMLNSIAATFKRRPRASEDGGGGSAGVSEGEGSDTGGGRGGGATKVVSPQFDFPKFLEQLKSRSAEPVAKYLKSFLTNFAKKSFSMNEMIKLVHDFLRFITARMKECEPWKSQSELEFDNSLDCMEKLVMNRLYPFTFTPQISLTSSSPITTDDLERDAVLTQRIRLFGWVEGKHLDVIDHDPEEDTDGAEGEQSEGATLRRNLTKDGEGGGVKGFLEFAGSELLKVNHYKAPRDKLICILNCCKVIFGLMRHLSGAKGAQQGADAFIPLLIYVVLKSNPEHLISNVEYINRFRSASKLQSEAGYYLSSLMGSITFIEAMDHSSLSNISKEEFDSQVSHSISLLPPPSPPTHSPSPSSNPNSRTLTPFSQTDSGEEPALPISSTAPAALLSMEQFFLRTGEAVSRPLNAIGQAFSDLIDGPGPDPTDSLNQQQHRQQRLQAEGGGGGGSVPYEARRRSPRPRSFVQLPAENGAGGGGYPGQHQPPPWQWQHNAQQQQQQQQHPGSEQQWREAQPQLQGAVTTGEDEERDVDYGRLQTELDRRDELAREASLQTLSQIFPNLEADLAALILDTKQGDLPSSIDALLEMGST